ncbi:Chloroperoxidase [Amylostereum chailletii]|nr:Chloroperoxidase [Amylostereum chailletii]
MHTFNFLFKASAIDRLCGMFHPPSRDELKTACPFAARYPRSDEHMYIPPSPHARRSPCPALNTLANHGYLPRSGDHITPALLAGALHTGFGLTYTLAYFLSYVGFLLQLGASAFTYGWEASLEDFARHGRIEHDASLAHADASRGMLYAPCKVNMERMAGFLEDAGQGIGLEDVARARVERERQSGGLDTLHGVIARGEMALVLGIFGSMPAKGERAGRVPVDVLKQWWTDERFPVSGEEEWAPRKKQGLFETLLISLGIEEEMCRLKKEAEGDPSVWSLHD